jgi:hypothetical protein
MSEQTITMTEGGEQALSEMLKKVGDIRNVFGDNSKEYLKAVESLAHSLAQVLRLGGRITSDGEAALYGVSFIHYGVVFHASRKAEDAMFGVIPGEWSVHS